MSGRRGGRPSKGQRKPMMVRPPLDMHAELEARRVAAGYSNLNDYVVDVLALHLGREITPPAPPPSQELLPLIGDHVAA